MACQESNLTDRISELPDHILTSILPLLTLKEAGQTSVLSKRWRYLWAYIPTLNFVNYEFLSNYCEWVETTSLEEEESKYFCLVDRIVTSHKGPTIDEFKVQFDLQESRKDNVDNWVKFAMEKRVKRFLLDIAPINSFQKTWTYAFPSLSLSNSLTSLQLGYVNVTDEFLEKVLSDCPLKHLSLVGVKSLVSLKVAGPSLALKSLRMRACSVEHLEISAPNLMSFEYHGRELSSPFKSTPKLSEVTVGSRYASHLIDDFSDLSSCISQLEALTMNALYHKRITKVFPAFTRLKTLHILIDLRTDEDLDGLLSLLNHCPLLHTFVLESMAIGYDLARTTPAKHVEAHPHYCLKIVEIFKFVGWVLDIGIAKYLIENAVSLEMITIHPINQRATTHDDSEERRIRAEQHAEQLRSYPKPGTEFNVCVDSRKPIFIFEF